MSDRKTSGLDYAFFLGIPIGILVLFLIFQIDLPKTPAEWKEWTGGKAPPEIFALIVAPLGGVAAVIGLIINSIYGRRTLQNSVRTQNATNFQKGADLLASGSVSSEIAGIALLRQVAMEDPGTFLIPIIRTLSAFATEKSRPLFETLPGLWKAKATGNDYPFTPSSVLHAMFALSELRRDFSERFERPIVVNRIAISRFSGIKLECERFDFTTMLHNSIFEGGGIRNSSLSARIGRGVVFDGVDLTGTTLTFRIDEGELGPKSTRSLRFVNCTSVEGATINKMPLERWIADSAE